MKLFISLLSTLLLVSIVSAADADTRCFEMRTYHAAPGKLDDLNARFRNHTMKIFEKHGMANIGYWTPVENTNNLLIYVLAYPSREAREKAWKEFGADPEWQSVAKASEANGKLVQKVESVFLSPTDYSPLVKPSQSKEPRLFELRTYHASPGKLDDLNARFRNHTTSLFSKQGMANFGYWTPTEKKDGAGETLTYILAHKDKEAALESWKGFRADPDWIKAKTASEVNGPLTVKDGVKSVYMIPTDYSPTK
ncbi:NIPSNAP family protein [Pedosphaera parvula]|uniref:NIPSNAP family containing protein n=1 Tax=Pedosphaera parvula (strain Ellin514) TaxID=320771 RepID=B9XE82_PEDPL|nr:NIPSNAP family protein [Pedosphaera parvula]EEF61973.1 NIPSNAP family containing protein [Pedosphaera parvula Ellin514]